MTELKLKSANFIYRATHKMHSDQLIKQLFFLLQRSIPVAVSFIVLLAYMYTLL